MPEPYWLGFDIGGTRLKSAIVRADGALEEPSLEDTASLAFPAVFERLRRIADLRAGPDLRGIGVAAPGLVEERFGVRYLPGKVLGIEDFPLRESLERELAVPVRCVNDGQAATFAEWRFGAAAGFADVVGLTLGTGVGSGVVVGGRPLGGGHIGNGCVVGHFTIETAGRLCLCGNRGCAETLVSADAVAGRLREALTRRVPSMHAERFASDPASVDFEAVVEGVRAADPVCIEIMADFQRDLGATIVTAIHAYNPSVVVLAGGPLQAADLFLPQVQGYVDRHAFVFPKDRRVEVRRARLDSHAGVLGAVAMVMPEA